MRTPEQWQEAYTTMLSDEDKLVMQQWIAAIQSDAREGMVPADRLQAVEKERDRYKAALEEIAKGAAPVSTAEKALQPAQKEQK